MTSIASITECEASKIAAGRGRWKQTVASAIALFVLTIIVYIPVMRSGGFIWDDDAHVERNPTLLTREGLGQIWNTLGATQQYYPLVFSTFWVEHQLWGNSPRGYHVDNVVLHALSAIVLWRLLKRLRLPRPWVIAALFAIHPVNVESVAWISERKNVLSGLLALLAAMSYLRYAAPEWWDEQPQNAAHDRHGYWAHYAIALALFVSALCAKTVVCTLPAVMLLLIFWKRGRVSFIDGLCTAPFFVAGLGMAFVTAYMERVQGLAVGERFNFSLADRVLIAGRDLWFYASKLVWPAKLIFIYPRWTIDPHQAAQWLFPLAAIATVIAAWMLRKRIGRGVTVALLYFGGTLVPALGFVNVYPMRFSFVADHFQYLATVGIFALAVSITAAVAKHTRCPQFILRFAIGIVLTILAVLTMHQQSMYRDAETLWKTTIARNPAAVIGFTNLGSIYWTKHQPRESIQYSLEGQRLDPNEKVVCYNLGLAHADLREWELAIESFRRAIEIDPTYAIAHDQLGLAYERIGQGALAETHYCKAIQFARNDPAPYIHYAHRRAGGGAIGTAIDLLRHAVALAPSANTHYEFAVALGRDGQDQRAIAELREALRIQPDYAPARLILKHLNQPLPP